MDLDPPLLSFLHSVRVGVPVIRGIVIGRQNSIYSPKHNTIKPVNAVDSAPSVLNCLNTVLNFVLNIYSVGVPIPLPFALPLIIRNNNYRGKKGLGLAAQFSGVGITINRNDSARNVGWVNLRGAPIRIFPIATVENIIMIVKYAIKE